MRILEVGRFTPVELARLRLVNSALCDAASFPGLYPRRMRVNGDSRHQPDRDPLANLPAFVVSGLRCLELKNFRRLDLGDVVTRFPGLTSLSTTACSLTVGIEHLPTAALRELKLRAGRKCSPEALTAFTQLECLWFSGCRGSLPVAPCLRRLGLPDYGGDLVQLMAALTNDDCTASHLEALALGLTEDNRDTADLWFAPLAGLPALTEFKLVAAHPHALGGPGQANALAACLVALTALKVLELNVNPDCAAAVVDTGFPPGLESLQFNAKYFSLDRVIAVLPPGLTAFCFFNRSSASEPQLRALLDQCPRLEAMSLNWERVALWTLAEEEKGRPPMRLSGGYYWGQGLRDALEASAHTMGALQIGVHWRTAGGVVFNDQPFTLGEEWKRTVPRGVAAGEN